MKTLIILFALLLSACAHQPFTLSALQPGDSIRRVYRIYGQPTYNVPSIKVQGARALYYVHEDTVCSMTIKDEVIVRPIICVPWNQEFYAFIQRMDNSENLPQYRY